MADANTLGILLGVILGFLAGGLVVCIAYLCYRRRVKSYLFDSNKNGRPRDSRRATIEYYTAPSEQFPPNTVPMQVQPNVFKINKKSAGEGFPLSPGPDIPDGTFEGQFLHVTQAYEPAAIETIEEDADGGDEFSSSSSKSSDSAQESGRKKRPKKQLLSKRLSLPAGMTRVADLVHPSPEHFLRKKKGDLVFEQTNLEFSLFFDTASRELHITVIQVTGIPTPDESFLRLPNCSVKMRILPEMLSWQWSRKVSRTNNPTFNETFIIPGFVHNKLRECTVHFVVLDFDHVQDNVYVIGEVFMPLSELRANKLDKLIKQVNPLSF